MSSYRTGNHWGVTIVRSGVEPIEMGKRADDELVAVVVNGDTALAERICALLNGDAPAHVHVESSVEDWGCICDGSGRTCPRHGAVI